MPKRKQERIDEEEDDAYSKQTKYKESNRKARMRQREDATKLREEAAAKPPPPETGGEQPSISKRSVKGSKGTTATDDGTAAAMKEPAKKRVVPMKQPKKQLSTKAAKKSEVDTSEAMVKQCAKAIRDVIIKYHMSGGVANNLLAHAPFKALMDSFEHTPDMYMGLYPKDQDGKPLVNYANTNQGKHFTKPLEHLGKTSSNVFIHPRPSNIQKTQLAVRCPLCKDWNFLIKRSVFEAVQGKYLDEAHHTSPNATIDYLNANKFFNNQDGWDSIKTGNRKVGEETNVNSVNTRNPIVLHFLAKHGSHCVGFKNGQKYDDFPTPVTDYLKDEMNKQSWGGKTDADLGLKFVGEE